jgi:hypothetical protein
MGVGKGQPRTTHGMWKTTEYRIWQMMKDRCSNPNKKTYHRYGGRGIQVCERWKTSFVNFYQDMGPRPEKKTLDRVDNDGHYCPDNCEWRTKKEQSNNRNNNAILVFEGRRQNITEWSRELGFPRNMVNSRINSLGWTVRRTLTTPPGAPRQPREVK